MSLHVIAGGQFGSEAKGAVTAAVTADNVAEGHEVTVVRVGGPNAGHSAADPTGRIWALRQVPAGMVVDPSVQGVIASGSEIDTEVLEDEISRLAEAGIDITNRLVISDAVTVITPEHKELESSLVGAIGSTGKGIGAARAARLMRNADTARTAKYQRQSKVLVVPAVELEKLLNRYTRQSTHVVVIEGTQGYGLGLHTGFYPQVTSGDCRAIDFCAQAGINPWGAVGNFRIHLVIRPYPIRVAGNSGPLKGETTWEELNQPVELTTVTKKVRRVGTYDPVLVNDAIAANAPFVRLAVSMVDKVPGATDEGGLLTDVGHAFLDELQKTHGTPIEWVGTGPQLFDWFRWSDR